MNIATETTTGRLRFETLSRGLVFSMLGLFALSTAWAQSSSYSPQYPQYPYNYENYRYQGDSGQPDGSSRYQGQQQPTYAYDGQAWGGSGQPGGFSGYQGQQQPTYGYDGQAQGGGSGQGARPGGFSGYQDQQQSGYGYDRGVGGPSRESPVSGFRGYSGQQPAFGYESPTPRTGHVPTPGFRFRETNKRPEPDTSLPQYRPDSMMGNSPYSWGGANPQWSPGGAGPAPVFRPLEGAERDRAKRSTESSGRYQGGYVAPSYPAPGYPVQAR